MSTLQERYDEVVQAMRDLLGDGVPLSRAIDPVLDEVTVLVGGDGHHSYAQLARDLGVSRRALYKGVYRSRSRQRRRLEGQWSMAPRLRHPATPPPPENDPELG